MLTAVNENDSQHAHDYVLYLNYPNPFNPSPQIRFSLLKPANVTITINNMMDQRVKILVDRPMSAGVHNLIWNGTNVPGLKVASGICYYLMDSDLGNKTKE